jgi:hypothetical protein
MQHNANVYWKKIIYCTEDLAATQLCKTSRLPERRLRSACHSRMPKKLTHGVALARMTVQDQKKLCYLWRLVR